MSSLEQPFNPSGRILNPQNIIQLFLIMQNSIQQVISIQQIQMYLHGNEKKWSPDF